jgi:hypothetical protein
MALAHAGLALGIGLGLIGTATATDAVSLREVAGALDVPIVSSLVFGLRESMSTDVAHAVEAFAAMVGAAVVLLPIVRRSDVFWSNADANEIADQVA